MIDCRVMKEKIRKAKFGSPGIRKIQFSYGKWSL